MAPRSSPAKTRSSTAKSPSGAGVSKPKKSPPSEHITKYLQRGKAATSAADEAAASDVEEAVAAAPASPAALTTAPAGPSKRVALTEAEAAELKAFDLTMAFGPMVGLTRLERWERAQQAGLGPPAHLHALLLVLDEQSGGAQSVWGQSPLFKIPAPPPTM